MRSGDAHATAAYAVAQPISGSRCTSRTRDLTGMLLPVFIDIMLSTVLALRLPVARAEPRRLRWRARHGPHSAHWLVC